MSHYSYLSTHTDYQSKIYKNHYFGGFGRTGKWIQENVIFMRFFVVVLKWVKTEKLLNEQPAHAIAKCTLTGQVQ